MTGEANDYRKRWEEWRKTILLHLKNSKQGKKKTLEAHKNEREIVKSNLITSLLRRTKGFSSRQCFL